MLDLIRTLLVGFDTPTAEKVYEQDCAEFRALNAIFWQIPLIVMTLNGGLWFAVANLDLTPRGQTLILWFAVVVNLGFMIALIRLRGIMGAILKRIRRFEGAASATAHGSYVVITVFLAMLGLASIGAGMVAQDPAAYLRKKGPMAPLLVCQPTKTGSLICRGAD